MSFYWLSRLWIALQGSRTVKHTSGAHITRAGACHAGQRNSLAQAPLNALEPPQEVRWARRGVLFFGPSGSCAAAASLARLPPDSAPATVGDPAVSLPHSPPPAAATGRCRRRFAGGLGCGRAVLFQILLLNGTHRPSATAFLPSQVRKAQVYPRWGRALRRQRPRPLIFPPHPQPTHRRPPARRRPWPALHRLGRRAPAP